MTTPPSPVPGSVSPLQVALTEDGPVSVTSIDYLEQLSATAGQRVIDLSAAAAARRGEAEEAGAKAGAELVAHKAEWQSVDRAGRVEAARTLGQMVATLEQRIADVRAHRHHGLGGVVERVKDSHELDTLTHQLLSAEAELGNRYRAVVEGLEGETGVPSADALLDQARQATMQAGQLDDEQRAASSDLARLNEEIARRNKVVQDLGFDALGIEADLSLNGIRPITTNLVLKAKEVAAVQVPATLCRFATHTRYVGASQGVSIPLGHGFRYRVSSFRGHPIQSQSLTQVDTGLLVVTTQRIVFLGSKRDVSVPLAKLLQTEAYSDAIGIGREGKESRDIY